MIVSLTLLINDFDKMVKSFKSEITKAYFSLYNIGKIDVDMRDCLIKRIEDM